ncbi:hypothetical protein [Lysinibacillus capsici]|uniref:hypothetical protein n=1 Tax=Lysinibacillus capsici TaxID=2115968 RepID=UPI00131437AA|nr:hypothetical protein [Lysinibacillus capsici]
MAKMAKLTIAEMDGLSIGMVLDHIQLYADMMGTKDSKKGTVRKATQTDINALKI